MSDNNAKILSALEDVHRRIRTMPAERLEAAAWTAWQRDRPGDDDEGFEEFEADWRSGDLFPLLVWSWLASKYGASVGGEQP
jgi:hypothetical protein